MLIWLALVIPILTCVILLLAYPNQTNWRELFVPIGVSVVLIFVSKVLVEYIGTSATEYWTGYFTQARYYEPWNEYIHRICTEEVCSGSGKNRSCHTRIYDCSYVDYHPEYWEADDSNGQTLSISKELFEYLTKTWNQRLFVNMHRHYHTIDGDAYYTNWNQINATMYIDTTVHRYENRVAATNNTFQFQEVTKEEKEAYGLYDYPPVDSIYYQQSILGYNGPAERSLQLLNAELGRPKQVKVFILVYLNKPIAASTAQEAYWKGGNKNELVLTIGIDSNNLVQWSRAFSWTDSKTSVVEANSLVGWQINRPLDLEKIISGLYGVVNQYFVRKQFADFNYITVEPGPWSMVIVFFFIALVNVGCAYIVVNNDYN